MNNQHLVVRPGISVPFVRKRYRATLAIKDEHGLLMKSQRSLNPLSLQLKRHTNLLSICYIYSFIEAWSLRVYVKLIDF